MLENFTANLIHFQGLGFYSGVICLVLFLHCCSGRHKLDHIPAVGSKSRILSFLGAIDFMVNAHKIIQRGCQKYRNGIFRVPNIDRWLVIAHGKKYLEDIKNAPEDVISITDFLDELIQPDYTFDHDIKANPYHIPLLRTHLTKNLPNIFPALFDEVIAAFEDLIPATDKEWLKLGALETVLPIISRVTNRHIIGAPSCRRRDYVDFTVRFTYTVIKAGAILRYTPSFLKPLVAPWCPDLVSDRVHGVEYLRPIIEDRLRKTAEYGPDYPDKADDFLTWIMEQASKNSEESSVENIARRILTLNVAGIQNSSIGLCHALFYLANYPEYADVLREEVKGIVDREGWTYRAVNQMVKVDSFIRESQRLNSLQCVNMNRIVRQPFTFSDGTSLPPGTLLGIASNAIQMDEFNYSNPLTFMPFRYVRNKEDVGRKMDMTATHSDYLAFGYGRHACPGRFFVAVKLKLMLALMIMNYDMKLEGLQRPDNVWVMTWCIPNPKGNVLFRRRVGSVKRA